MRINSNVLWNANKTQGLKKAMLIAAIFVVAFLLGRGTGAVKEKILPASNTIKNSKDWGLGFGADGTQPSGTDTVDDMKKYDAYYLGDSKKKVLYLTFDCGYENGNTPAILDALKKHKAPGTFFVVGHFLKENPELIKRMIKEGHTVGNHTYTHPDVSNMSEEEFGKQLSQVSDMFKQITGKELDKYYRAPRGKFSEENLKQAQSFGYKTFFWSLAYVDWNTDKQPTKEEAFSKLLTRVHPGAIVLLHNTSKTNGEIMDELLTKWEEMGYQFKPLSDLWKKEKGKSSKETSKEASTELSTETSTELIRETSADSTTSSIEFGTDLGTE